MYSEFACAVKVDHEMSDWFILEQGVQQGAPISMWLYEIFINDLLTELRESGLGASYDDIKITCPSYADDVSIIATSAVKLQQLLNIAHSHSLKWRYSYNAAKSFILCSKNRQKPRFFLGNENLNVVKKCSHLGTVMTFEPCHEKEFYKEKVYAGRQAMMAVNGIGSKRVPVSTKLLCNIFWSVSVPIITYGSEITPISSDTIEVIETAQWEIAKYIQRLPHNTPNPLVLPQLGWLSMSRYLHLVKILFLSRVLQMSSKCLCKQIAIRSIYKWYNSENYTIGPAGETMAIAHKYDVSSYFVNYVLHCVSIQKDMFNRLVKENIRKNDVECHVISLKMYKHVSDVYECITHETLWPWFKHVSYFPEQSYMCNSMLRLAIGLDKCEATSRPFTRCVCNPDARFSACHVLFECDAVTHERTVWLGKVRSVAPQPFFFTLCEMSLIERTRFILSGFCSKYICEHSELYSIILYFVYNVYRKWKQINNG